VAPTLRSANIAGAEVAGLVHVKPEAVQRQRLVEGADLGRPPAYGLLGREVWEVHRSRPQLQGMEAAFGTRHSMCLCVTPYVKETA
jgi:hypothetical protein